MYTVINYIARIDQSREGSSYWVTWGGGGVATKNTM